MELPRPVTYLEGPSYRTTKRRELVWRPVLDRFGLIPSGHGTLTGVDGFEQIVPTAQMRIGAPPFDFAEVTVMVVDWQPAGCDDIVGMDYLIQIDFAVRRGTFGPI